MNLPDLIQQHDALIILAGAGMSAELGVPAYWTGDHARYGSDATPHGFTHLEHATASTWKTNQKAQVSYFKEAFRDMESLNFEGSSYEKLLKLSEGKDLFVITSNVDSAFHNAGFPDDRLFEVHGSYRNSQCLNKPHHPLFPTTVGRVPLCPTCGSVGRPNVLFFDDNKFSMNIYQLQEVRLNRFLKRIYIEEKDPVLLELGVGTTVPRIRSWGDNLYSKLVVAPYIHVNLEPRPKFLKSDVEPAFAQEYWVRGKVGDVLGEWEE